VAATVGSSDAGFSLPGLDPWTYLLSQRRVVVTYLRLALAPVGQTVDRDVPRAAGLLEPAGLAAGLLLLALLALALVLARRGAADEQASASRLAAFGLLWFFVALAPTSSVLPLLDLAMEHRCYLGLLGLSLADAALGWRALDRWLGPAAPRAAAALTVGAWVALALALHARNAVWETRRALWTDAAAKGPALARPLVNLAQAVAQAGDAGGAVALARQARARLAPGDQDGRLRVDEAEATFLLEAGRAAEVRALLSPVLARGEPTVRILALQAAALAQTGDASAGEALAQAAVRSAPGLGVAWSALAACRLALARPCEAAGDFARALELEPGLSGARLGLAAARAACPVR
jgi:protein O-mannosyl-transferase